MLELIEKLKQIENQPNYYISNHGRVFSKNKYKELTLLKYSPNDRGYTRIDFRKNGIRYSESIHRLVANHFIPNPKNKLEVNHIDGNKSNNHISNLEWVTPSENQIHAFKTDLRVYHKGSKHHNSKLTENEVLWIRENYHLYKNVEIQKNLAFVKLLLQE